MPHEHGGYGDWSGAQSARRDEDPGKYTSIPAAVPPPPGAMQAAGQGNGKTKAAK